MRTQTDIENERRWTIFGAQSLLIVYALVAIGYGYQILLDRSPGNSPLLAHTIATAVTCLCVMPGIFLWKYLRSRSKYAALYGLLVSATLCIVTPQLIA